MAFVHFTNPIGGVVTIKPESVAVIRPPIAGADHPNTRAVIVLENGQTQAVQETVAEVEGKLK